MGLRFLYSVLGFTILSFVASMPAFADDDCVAGDATPAFQATTKGLKDYKVKKAKDENEVTETFKLFDGTEVTVRQGGCAHFDKSVTFQMTGVKTKQNQFTSKQLIELSRSLLSKLPSPNEVVSALRSRIKQQEKALLEASPAATNGEMELQSTDSDGYSSGA